MRYKVIVYYDNMEDSERIFNIQECIQWKWKR